MDSKISFIKDHIKSYPDFPKKGILYQDIFSAFSDGKVCKTLNEVLIQYVKKTFPDVEAIVGLESRGFFFCFSIAADLEVACVPIRKKGKLPGDVVSHSYVLEYGSDIMEIQRNAFKKPKTKCLIVDDLLATGGTMGAAIQLLKECQCDIIGCITIIELENLNGKDKLSNIPFHSLIKF